MRCNRLVAAISLALAAFTNASRVGAQSGTECDSSPCPLIVQQRFLGYSITEGVTGRRVMRFAVLAPAVDILGERSAAAAAEYSAFRRGWNAGFALSGAAVPMFMAGTFLVLDGRESGNVVISASALALISGVVLQRLAIPRLYRSVETYNATRGSPPAVRRR